MLGDLFKPETGRLLVERTVEAFGGLEHDPFALNRRGIHESGIE
jgi:hypothetical protein